MDDGISGGGAMEGGFWEGKIRCGFHNFLGVSILPAYPVSIFNVSPQLVSFLSYFFPRLASVLLTKRTEQADFSSSSSPWALLCHYGACFVLTVM